MLKVSHLMAFNEVMLTGSISEAARHLHRTQSSVSATIAGVEEELGMQLFERKGGRLHPVPEAQYLHNECSEILRRLETVSDNMHRIKSLQTGELHIASMPGPSVFFIPNLIAQHGVLQRNIRSNVVSRSSEGVYRLMAAQRYDIGLADYLPDRSAEASLIDSQVFEFRCLCALPENDPLRENDVVTPKDLEGLPLAMLGQEQAVHSDVVGIFAQGGLTPNIRYMTQYFLPLLTYVEQGLACAVVDPITAESYRLLKDGRSRLQFKPIEPPVYFRVVLITPKHRPSSVIATHFVERLKAALEAIRDTTPNR